MSKYLLLRGYNSYQNRIVKKEATLGAYETAVGNGNYALREQVNFYEGNGIFAQIIYNYRATDALQGEINYVVVADDLGNIEKRYFAMENVHQRNGQIICNLRRDVVADYYSNILDAPAFIEKATLQASDPMVFNSEGMKFNQIKTDNEILLKDETQTPWIIGYIAPKAESETNKEISGQYTHDIDYTTSNINNWNSSLIGNDFLALSGYDFIFAAEGDTLYNYVYQYTMSVTSGGSLTTTSMGRIPNTYKYREDGTQAQVRTKLSNAWRSSYATDVGNAIAANENYDGFKTYSEINNLIAQYNNKIVKDTSSNKLYRVRYNYLPSGEGTSTWTVGPNNFNWPAVYSDMQAMAGAAFRSGHGSTDGFKITGQVRAIRFYIEEVQTSDIPIKMTIHTTRKQLVDAPYCMFAIPLYQTIVRKADSNTFYTDQDAALAMARTLSAQLGDACYDVQLLPYCPRIGIWDYNEIDLTNSTLIEGRDYEYFGDKEDGQWTTIFGVLIWCGESEFNVHLPVNLSTPATAIGKKIQSETEMYRLCSPNYAAAYEFNVAKNGGVSYIDIDCAYKPYNPYIHANPVFGGIYGVDTNDTRGLVCQGDFSLPQSTEQWKQYEINNKNYQASFDRQIDNMDVMHRYEKGQAITSAVTGAVQGALVGAAVGGVGGAVVGGLASAAGGAQDIWYEEQKYKENKAYAKDQFNYQLDNIKARPNTLGKVSAYNPNNKVFLFLEKYHATDEEVAALKNQVFYGGMTVGRIGTIREFIQNELGYAPTTTIIPSGYNFVKGKIIAMDISEDAHLMAEILNEINEGVYVGSVEV